MDPQVEVSPFTTCAHLSSGAQSRILIWRSEVASAHDAATAPRLEPLSSSSASSSASSDPSSDPSCANLASAGPLPLHSRRRRRHQFSWRLLARRLSMRPLVSGVSSSVFHFDDADASLNGRGTHDRHELVHTSMYRDLAPRAADANLDDVDLGRSTDDNQRPTIRQRHDRLARAARLLMSQPQPQP